MLKDGEKGVIIQRDRETYGVAPHIPCGLVSPETLRKLADTAEKFGAQQLKITSAARIAMLGIREEDVDAVWQDLDMDPGYALGMCIRSVKACPGTTFCKRGKMDSLGMGLQLDRRYTSMKVPGKLKMGVSGCPMQCAETCIKDIGLVGTTKGWTLLVGGQGGSRARLADVLYKELGDEEVLRLVDQVVSFFIEHTKPGVRLSYLVQQMGLDAFREAVDAQPPLDPAPAS